MLLRLVGKLLLKATVPLVAVAGVLSYGSYLRGGDPAALWRGAADSSLAQVQKVFAGLKSDASQAAGAVSSTTQGLTAGLTGSDHNGSDDGLATVFTWQDAQGVKHYSTVKPDHVRASTVTVDPNVNVLAPVRRQPTARQPGTAEVGGSLPGVAGQVLSTSSGGDAAALDPAQLIRMLQ